MIYTMSSEAPTTRDRILSTTALLLEQDGGQGVRMADIAKRAGVSRQAVYLHFSNRAELLIATTQFRDDQLDLAERLAPSRGAGSGEERLSLYVEFWCQYVPHIYGIAKALIEVQDTDDAAAMAWQDRMTAHRDGCRAAIAALRKDQRLAAPWTTTTATDVLWSLLSVSNWEQLTHDCGWSGKRYVSHNKEMARRLFVADAS